MKDSREIWTDRLRNRKTYRETYIHTRGWGDRDRDTGEAEKQRYKKTSEKDKNT